MNEKILLTEKVKTLQELTQFMKNIDYIEGSSLMLDFMKAVKKNVLQIKINDRKYVVLMKKLMNLKKLSLM